MIALDACRAINSSPCAAIPENAHASGEEEEEEEEEDDDDEKEENLDPPSLARATFTAQAVKAFATCGLRCCSKRE